MAAPVTDKDRVGGAARFDIDSDTLSEDQRAFIRSMRDAANGVGQPAREFMEELRQEMLKERAAENNGSNRNA